MSAPIRIVTIHGDWDVLIGKRWQRSFDARWKARLYRLYLRYRAAQPVGTAKPESEKSPRLDVNHE